MSPMFYEDSLGTKIAAAWNALGSADDELIEDPEALDEAQREVDKIDPQAPPDPDDLEAVGRTFTLAVPRERPAEAREAISDFGTRPRSAPAPAPGRPPGAEPWPNDRRTWGWLWLVLIFGLPALVLLMRAFFDALGRH